MKNTTFIFITAILVAIIAFCIAGTVEGQESGAGAAEEAFYKEQEAQLLQDTKAYLRELGFANSGVTLNRIVDAEGKREYTFTIHHSRIDKMDAADRNDLAGQLADREVSILDAEGAEKCIIHYDFLIL